MSQNTRDIMSDIITELQMESLNKTEEDKKQEFKEKQTRLLETSTKFLKRIKSLHSCMDLYVEDEKNEEDEKERIKKLQNELKKMKVKIEKEKSWIERTEYDVDDLRVNEKRLLKFQYPIALIERYFNAVYNNNEDEYDSVYCYNNGFFDRIFEEED